MFFNLPDFINLNSKNIITILDPKICIHCAFNQARISNYSPVAQTPESTPSKKVPQQVVPESTRLTRLPVGINVGKNNVIVSTFVRGLEDGSQAVDFENWLITFKDVQTALDLNVKTLADGQLEIRTPGLVTRLNPQELKTDPELGLVLSIADIKTKFGVKSEFNIVDYVIVLNPPWLNLSGQQQAMKALPIILEGLPKINSQDFNFSAIGQKISLAGNSQKNSLNSQGNITAMGTLLAGSWMLRVNQSDLSDTRNWKLTEAQYLRQTPNTDYVVGSQQTFWTSQGQGSYWGLTAIQRFGFTSKTSPGGGFSPSQRLQTEEITRTITGEAKPGTLVQLKPGIGDIVIREVLVDSSGVYRFDNVPFGGNNSQNYRIYLYPNGQLTAQPIIQEAKSSPLSGQLSPGKSALIISGGLSQQSVKHNFIGTFNNWRGGLVYRRGITENLTLGAGVVYDQTVLGIGEVFYQPMGIPLRLNAAFLMGTKKKGWEYNANLSYNPSRRLNMNYFSDRLTQRFELNWTVFSGLGLKISTNSKENTFITGLNLSHTGRNFSIFTSTDIDTKSNWRWNLLANYQKLQINHRNNEISNNSEIKYNFNKLSDSGHVLLFNYEAFNNKNQDYLASIKWRYRSNSLLKGYRPLWEFDLGYGAGSRGSGLIVSASTAIVPGLIVELRYQEISPTSNDSSFKIDLIPTLNFQPGLSPGDSRFERLRSEGGIIVQPFLDDNGNGKLDNNEKVYTEDVDLLIIINNRTLKSFEHEINSRGVFVRLTPGTYRLDFEPSGYPLNRKPQETAYAVEVVAGSYTYVQVPMMRSYTVAGKVTDSAGNPLNGVKVEAILNNSKKSVTPITSITNGAGIFFLEEMQLGSYQLLVNGKPAQSSMLEINKSSPLLQEINLSI